MWKWIISVLVIAAVGAAAWAAVTAARPVETGLVRRGTVSAIVDERARTRLPRTYHVTMPIAGRILPIALTEGDPVAAGEVVARIEGADLDTAVEVAEARARRLQARIIENNDTRLEESTIVELDSVVESVDRSVEASLAETEASKAREEFHGRDLERKQEAFERKATSQIELDEAELAEIESRVDYRTDVLALRALEAVRRAVEIWPLQVRQMIEKKALAEAVLKHELAEAMATLDQARRDRERAQIRSPVDGIVLERYVTNIRMLPAGEPLLDIGRLEDLEVEVEVLSEEAVDIVAGDPVEIVVPSVPGEPLVGAVSRIEPRGFTKVSSLGVEQQRVLVIVSLDAESIARYRAAGYGLGVGYRLRVRIETDTRPDAVVIPRAALFRGVGGRWQVFVVRGGRARLADVEIGLLNDHDAEALTGVQPGEAVILAPETSLEDGERVKSRG